MKKVDSFWAVLFLCQILSMLFIKLDLYYQVANGIFFYQALRFFYDFGNGLSIRYLMGMLYSLNYLFGPVLMYEWLNPFVEIQYTLKGDPNLYFSYAIPAILCMLAGLHLFARKGDERLDTRKIRAAIELYPKLPLHLILFGLGMSVVTEFLPGEIKLIASSLANLKYVGLFLHILTTSKLNYLYLALTYGVLVLQSLVSSMFNDLLNLLFFLGIIISIRFKLSALSQIMILVCGIFIIFLIQVIKVPLRSMVIERDGYNVEFTELDEAFDASFERSANQSFAEKTASVVSRTSQGWITSNVLNYYYREQGFKFQNGKHSLIMLKSSVLPKVLAPDKYNVGDIELFNTYSGHTLFAGTSMALGVLSDGFIDFGYLGVLICFIWGMIFSAAIKLYDNMDKKYPLAKILSVLSFFYAIRPDTDTHSALGSIVKISLVLWLVMIWFKRNYFPESYMKAIRRIATGRKVQ